MKLISTVIVTLLLICLAQTKVLAQNVKVLDFSKAPFNGQISEKEIQKILYMGGIRAILSVPTYVSLFVDGKLVSGIAPRGTEAVLVPNDDNDYYTVLPIIGGINVNQKQKEKDFESAPHIQLIWYFRDDRHDAIYSLISLES